MRKLLVVTGGTKGIGLAIIHKFAAEGFDLVTCSRNQEQLETLQKNLKKQYKDINLFIFKADLSFREEVIDFGTFINSLGRPVDVLVNNAGVFLPGAIHAEPEGNLERMIESNLYSAYYLTRHLVFDMKSRSRGHIFNMCSVASFMAYPNGGSYAISKFALLGMSKSLREELKGYGIRVTAVMPGATYTASWAGVEISEERFMPPQDVAEMVYASYALSPRSVVEDIVIRPQEGDL